MPKLSHADKKTFARAFFSMPESEQNVMAYMLSCEKRKAQEDKEKTMKSSGKTATTMKTTKNASKKIMKITKKASKKTTKKTMKASKKAMKA